MTVIKNLLFGAGTVLNIQPQTPKRRYRFYSKSFSDAEAIRKDFDKVGQDLWKIINEQKENERGNR